MSHPGGSLGRKLLLRVRDIMHTGDSIPHVAESASVGEAVLEMTAKKLGMTAVIEAAGQVCGIFTDGDLRRMFEKTQDIGGTRVGAVMTRRCTTISADLLAAEALRLMEERRINALLIVDDSRRLVGALNMHDLLRAGVV
jgi:arabinose-5-phosphate isomerase